MYKNTVEEELSRENCRGEAARLWCLPSTEKKEMDVELATEMGEIIYSLRTALAASEKFADEQKVAASDLFDAGQELKAAFSKSQKEAKANKVRVEMLMEAIKEEHNNEHLTPGQQCPISKALALCAKSDDEVIGDE